MFSNVLHFALISCYIWRWKKFMNGLLRWRICPFLRWTHDWCQGLVDCPERQCIASVHLGELGWSLKQIFLRLYLFCVCYIGPNILTFILLFTYFNELLFSLSKIVINSIKSLCIEFYQLSDLIVLFITHANGNTRQETVARLFVTLVWMCIE